MSEDETINLVAVGADGRKIMAALQIWESDPGQPAMVKLLLSIGDRALESISEDFFHALVSIRLELESDNLLLRCYGASLNVYPSPIF